MAKISPHALIDPKARLAEDVEVGPFCVIGPDVTIDAGCRLYNNVTIMGNVSIGPGNVIHTNAVIGSPPQDRKYAGAATRIQIGTRNIIREAVTIHLGTERGGGVTRIGDNNFLMINTHVGHDVQIANNCVLTNNTMIAGHVVCGDNVYMMGGVGINHFVTIGEFSFIGGYARIHHDVPPFLKVDGSDVIRGLNVVGLRRGGLSAQDVAALEEAYRRLFGRAKDVPFSIAMAEFNTLNGMTTHVKRLIDFLQRRTVSRHGRHLQSLL